MGYEINFIGISEETKDSDAIALRWKNEDGSYTIGIYDGGNQKYGEELGVFLDKYFLNEEKKNIDFVICSHSDMDHTSGLKYILENYQVDKLYMNRPWNYVKELFPYVDDGRITEDSLNKRLHDSYSYISELEIMAKEKNIPIYDAFQGTLINDYFCILSPSKKFYLDLVKESEKTPLEESTKMTKDSLFSRAKKYLNNVFENWNIETLKEDVSTSAENEMSVICLGGSFDTDDKECFLLTGDAGIRDLTEAIKYSDKGKEFSLKNNVNFIQIPHHGGRHNISPSLLNKLLGPKITENSNRTKTAFCSVGKNSDHPLKMVENAFIRRGCKVFKTNGKTICHHVKINFNRDGWGPVQQEQFSNYVESWED